MVDFRDRVKKKRAVDVTNLGDLFNSLDRHASHIELRPVQAQALELLSQRRKEHDLILKISTGSGKTLVGLLYLQSHMEEREEPVVYLCPTIQLAEQVLEEASKLGIQAEFYPGNEPHPPVEGIRGKSIIVCTYAKLFNAKTTFDRSDVLLDPCAMVLDDVHAGIEEIRNNFTLRIDDPKIRGPIVNLLSAGCNQYRPGLWQNLVAGDPILSFEVPFWIWKPLVPEILNILIRHADDDSFRFVWPYIREVLPFCRCIVSADSVEIAPDILPIYNVRAYAHAPHRLFMSGTLADDSVLVREIGADVSAAKNPSIPATDYGLGERMVLAPALVDKRLNRQFVMKMSKALSNRANVVVICASEGKAREWEVFGGRVVLGGEVSQIVKQLKNPKSKPQLVVFAQRYDGIDLPDNSCRVLVIDGMPFGENLTDRHDVSTKATPTGVRNKTVYRIEQGMGRAVRSHVDYAVVILSGPELANFIAKKDVLNTMNPETKAQLQLALDLAKLAKEDSPENPGKAVVDMVLQCLGRDNGWKQYYNERVRSLRITPGATPAIKLEMANSERRAFESASGKNPQGGVNVLQGAINNNTLSDEDRGWYLQKLAGYLFDVDKTKSLEVQRAAYELNKSLFAPPKLKARPQKISESKTQANIMAWLDRFENPNGAIAAVQELKAKLSFEASSESVEQGILDLASLLGVTGSRPEKEFGEGPDDLWLWPSISLVIEVKSQNEESLHRKDAGQLMLSLKWFQANYPTSPEGQPVIVAKVSMADKKSGFPSKTRIITPEKMELLLNNIEKFYQAIISDLPASRDVKGIGSLLPKFDLAPEQFIGHYTVAVKSRS